MTSTAKPKRMGWGALLKSAKEKKERQGEDEKPTKKIKTSNTKEEEVEFSSSPNFFFV